jgi:hypothetical protein
VSISDFVGLTVSISEPFLAQISENLGLSLPDNSLRKTTLPVCQRSAAIGQLTAAGRSLLYRCDARFGELEQDDFVAGLVSAAADAEKFDDRSDLSERARAVRLALDCMKDRLGGAIWTIPAELTTITRRGFVGGIPAAKASLQRFSGVRLQVSKD